MITYNEPIINIENNLKVWYFKCNLTIDKSLRKQIHINVCYSPYISQHEKENHWIWMLCCVKYGCQANVFDCSHALCMTNFI